MYSPYDFIYYYNNIEYNIPFLCNPDDRYNESNCNCKLKDLA